MEIIAVATIITILAMILIPMLRERVASSKGKAALDEMSNLAKVISISYAENDFYFRLQDLNNTSRYDANNPGSRAEVVPYARYMANGTLDIALTDGQRAALSQTWAGPYASYLNVVKMSELSQLRPEIITETTTDIDFTPPVTVGPIVVYSGNTDEDEDLYPLDPWGNPYLFFVAVETLYAAGGSETNYYGQPAIFSMGPNGNPGDLNEVTSSADYLPRFLNATGTLGTGDDIAWRL
ncbi:hypothetical protein HQ520_12695 [bacterium]|nr:hypothetical protein [bacterium]